MPLRNSDNDRDKLNINNLSENGRVWRMHTHTKSIDFIVALVDKIRPKKSKNFDDAEKRFKAVLFELQNDKSLLFSLRKALLHIFNNTSIQYALTESGIIRGRGFIQELGSKIKHKILPEIYNDDNFLYAINKIFHNKKDYVWVEGIDKELWISFFRLLGIQVNLTNPRLIKQFCAAMQTMSIRLASLSMEKELHRFAEVNSDINFWFLEQARIVNDYCNKINNGASQQSHQNDILMLEEALYNCQQSILWIKEQRKLSGTSLAQTFILTRIEENIQRILIICDVLDGNHTFNTDRFVEFFTTSIKFEKTKNSLRAFFSNNTSNLAYQIAEHGGRTGEKFITSTRKEYWLMFKSAASGGFIISLIAIIKTFIGNIPNILPFWRGILQSGNYSLGFILIQDTNSTLATKQPAYTANNIAQNFDQNKFEETPDLRNIAITIGKVSRTQIISFAGNLIVVFPLTFFLAFLYERATGSNLLSDEMAQKSLADLHPFKSASLFFAAITGVFLFLSGLIAGYVENYLIYSNVASRVKALGWFKHSFSEKWQNKILYYIENRFGALIGNISLGFFLGMAGFFGKTFGLPIDIRHITISAANSAVAFEHLGFTVGIAKYLIIFIGVLLIGIINFAVSFSLAFFVAIKSRGIHLKDYPEFFSILVSYFFKYPSDFIKAPKRPRLAQDL